MGKKMSIFDGMEKARLSSNDSVYANPNKYGYKINVNHPQIRPLYERYKEHLGERVLSDRQRFTFENIIFQMIEKGAFQQ